MLYILPGWQPLQHLHAALAATADFRVMFGGKLLSLSDCLQAAVTASASFWHCQTL